MRKWYKITDERVLCEHVRTATYVFGQVNELDCNELAEWARNVEWLDDPWRLCTRHVEELGQGRLVMQS